MTRSAGRGVRHARVRCAIYTRKSSEEGLEQEFNSLLAQREACEAFITSQRHEGWVCLGERPDCLLEGDGFEPSVPRRNKLCVAPATNVPGRDDPLRPQLGSGCKAEADQPTTLRRVRLARIRVWRS